MVKRLLLVSMLLFAARAEADSFWINMQETDDLRLLYFHPLTTHLVPHVTRSFQNSLNFQREIFGWTPYEKTTVMLQDWVDYGNAGASTSRSNVLWFDVAPLNHSFETFPAVERVYMLMNHELVHLATGDAANSQDLFWRRIFGGKPYPVEAHPESLLYHYLTTPRNVAPRWFFEGTATFMETWMSGGIGRAQGAYDEMKFRSMVRDGQPFYSNLGLVAEGTAADFQTMTNAYFYGTRFVSFLAYTHSPEQIVEWIRRDEGSQRYYAAQFRQVFGMSLEEAWDSWIAFETEFQTRNLESVRQFPVTPTTPIIDTALGSVSRSYVDSRSNTLVGGFYYPGVVGHLGAISLDDGTTRRLTDIKAPMKYRVTSLAYDPDRQLLFFTTDNLRLRDLRTIPLNGGEERMLIEDARIGDLAFNRADGSLWGVRNESAYVSLVRLNPPYQSWEVIHTLPYGQVLSDLDVSPDGTLLSASMEQVDGSQSLRLFRVADLLNGRFEAIGQFDFGRAVPEGFVFSPDGRYLFGSSYYTGVSNIFRYEVATGDIEAVSNAETGFFLPVPLEDGSLIVWEYTGQGLVPKRIDPVPLTDVGAITFLGNEIAGKHPVVTEWAVGSPMKIDVASLNPQPGKYYPLRQLHHAAGFPIIEGYRDTYALGWSMQWEDPLMFHSLTADLSYSVNTQEELSNSERWHADLQYEALYWRFRYWHNNADFYDLFGPTERARKGDAYIAGYDYPLIFDGPRRLDGTVELAYYSGLDTLPGNQNVGTGFEELLSFYAELDYQHTQESLGAVDHEKGILWDMAAYLDHAKGDIVPKFRAGFDMGFALPIKHSSLWLYNDTGIADGDRDNPLANWYFGAFGNNYVDDREVKRYREFFSFPGFDIDQLSAQDFVRSVLEWNLPPMRFANVGLPSLFLSSARPALFAGMLLADLGDDEYRETYYSLGLQVDFAFTVAHRHPVKLSVGFARGYIDGDKNDDELMVSLKIL
jgi:hypothetical protein